MRRRGKISGEISNLPATPAADLYQNIRNILLFAKTQARRAVNDAMAQAYWHVGRLIVEDEQGGEKRAEYGKRVLPKLARHLSAEFGKGFSAQSLWNYRQFYLEFPILSTAWRELSWSHFKTLIRDAHGRALRSMDAIQMRICWGIGRHIVEFEQGGAVGAR